MTTYPRLLAVVGLSLLVFVGACSSSGTSSSSGGGAVDGGGIQDATTAKCASRSGTYSYVETFVSGDCGPAITNTLDSSACSQAFCYPYATAFEAGGLTEFPPEAECKGTITTDSDNCAVNFSYKCPNAAGTIISQTIGKATWSADGKTASGTKGATLFNAATGAVGCSGTYTVKVTAL